MKNYKRNIHEWFGLTYAQYLIIPRSVLQSMPEEWQEKLVELIEELDETFEWRRDGQYVIFRNHKGRMMPYSEDEFGDYNRGKRIITKKESKKIIERYKKARKRETFKL